MQARLWLLMVFTLAILPLGSAMAASYCVDVFSSPIRLGSGLTLDAISSLDSVKRETQLLLVQEGKSGPFRGRSKFAVYGTSLKVDQDETIELVLIASSRPEGSALHSNWKLSKTVSLSTRNHNGDMGELVRLVNDSAGPFYSTQSSRLQRSHYFAAQVLLGDKPKKVLVKLTERNVSEDLQNPIWSGTYDASISLRD